MDVVKKDIAEEKIEAMQRMAEIIALREAMKE